MAAGKKVALIIGNSSYQFGERLPNPGNDADRVAQAARQAGFDVIVLKDLGQMQFKASLREFRTKADGAEVALLYYAGHGIEKDNANYLIPIDAKLADPIDLRDEGIDLALVIDNMSKAERRVILLDACRDNPFRNRWSDATRSFFKNGLGEMQLPFNSLVIFATAAGMKTPDGDAGGNSTFAVALANQIVKPGLALQNFGPSVMDEVKKATGGQQQPYYQATLDSTMAFFVPPPTPASNGLSDDEVDWVKAKNVNTAESFRVYMRLHPQGKYFVVAQSYYEDKLLSGNAGRAPSAAPPASTPPAPAPQPAPELIAQQRPEPAPTYAPAPAAAQPIEQTAQVAPQSTTPVYGPTAPPVTTNPAPQPQPAPVFTQQAPAPAPVTQSPATNFPPAQPQPQTATYTLPPAQAPITQPPVSAAPQAAAQPGTYVAPPIQRRYGAGGFPIMPDPPAFDYGPYPTCKDNWLALTDPMARVNATIACGNAFTDYQTNWLNKYRVAMNNYGTLIGEIYTNEVASPRFPDRAAEQGQFYQEMDRRIAGVKDGGYLMADYEKAKARFKADSEAVKDTYYRATGCKGYPLPAGLAPNPTC